MKLRELREKRSKTVKRMRAISDAPANGSDLSDEQAAEFATLEADLASTDAAITRAERIEDAERRMEGTPIGGGDVQGEGQFDELCRAFSIRAMIANAISHMTGVRVDAGREMEVSAELVRRTGQQPKGMLVPLQVFHRRAREQRAPITTALPVAGPGANIIGTDHRGDLFIDILRARLVTGSLGATVLSDLRGNVDIPRLDQSATAEWIAENTALSGSQPEFGKISMTPKHVGALVEWSRNMILQSSPDIEQLMRNDLSRVLAEAIDKAALRGTGGVQPVGVLHTQGIGLVDMQDGPTWGDILAVIAAVENANAPDGNGWTASPNVKRKLRMTPKQTGGTEGNFLMTEPNSLAGYPFLTSTLAPQANSSPDDEPIIFGYWPDLLIGYWGALDILINPFADSVYSKGNVLCRALMSCDVEVRHPESFAASETVNVN